MIKNLLLISIVVGALLAPACTSVIGKRDEAGGKLKVGIVFDIGGKDDKSFNAAALEGVKRAKQELVCLLAQLLLMVCTAVLGVWLRLPQLCLFGIILTGIAAMLGGLAEAKEQKALVRWTKAIIAANAVWIPIVFLLPQFRVATLDILYAIPAWLVAAAIFIPNLLAKESVLFRAERTVIDRLRLRHLAVRSR